MWLGTCGGRLACTRPTTWSAFIHMDASTASELFITPILLGCSKVVKTKLFYLTYNSTEISFQFRIQQNSRRIGLQKHLRNPSKESRSHWFGLRTKQLLLVAELPAERDRGRAWNVLPKRDHGLWRQWHQNLPDSHKWQLGCCCSNFSHGAANQSDLLQSWELRKWTNDLGDRFWSCCNDVFN